MADALVSALVNTILENLTSLSTEGIGLVEGLKTEVENLGSTLTTIQAVLRDAEEKQWKSEAVRNWLAKLKQVAYSLEDVLEDFQTEAVRRTLHKDVTSQVSSFFSLQNPLLFRLNMARQFKNVREKLDAIAAERTKFHLREGVAEVGVQRREERQTSSLVTESEVYGRESEKENIVSMLLNNSDDHHDLSVLAICGMGGLGKTTMAQLVYNDESVRKAFDLRVWVSVSDDFDIKRLTKAIVESIEGSPCHIQGLDPLQRHLEENLIAKRFLLVLDDVWNEYHDKWDGLKEVLRRGAKGSTVIVTTRIKKVALMMATVPVYRLGCLSDEDSWSLFKQRAFGMVSDEDNGKLEPIGRQIVKKCGGLPLAIKAIGCIMRLKSQESEWLHVKDSNIWDLEDEGSRILAVLRLSYEHLPPYMRQCFSFCSIFPKDYKMSKQQLIELWMANGFIPSRGAMDLHEMGCEIFNELTWRSFFQEVTEDNDGNVECKMHDLIHDVATLVMGPDCCAIDLSKKLKPSKTARHLYFYQNSLSTSIPDVSKMRLLRSFILQNDLGYDGTPPRFIEQKYLKVLEFRGKLNNIAVDHLKHLRYLNLSFSAIKSLPESTSCLHNLQTLDLKRCYNLQKLPRGMKQLKNLTYLDIKDCNALTSMPVRLGDLSCLRKLTMFIVGNEDGCGIDELKELALEGELSINELHNVKSFAEAKNSNLTKKQNLRSLKLFFEGETPKQNSSHENDEDVLNGLQPHSSLKKLCIRDYQGLRFPYWMMDLLLPNLVEIKLESFKRCDHLPPLGKLCFLRELTIWGMDALKSIDITFYGDGESSFPSLQVLDIGYMRCLEEWRGLNGRESFPLLQALTIEYCPKLVKLPTLQSIKRLTIYGGNGTFLKDVMRNGSILTCLQIFDIYDELTELPDGLLQDQKQLESLLIVSSSLKSLSNVLDNLSGLRQLDLQCCSELESLPTALQNLSCLEELHLSQCDRFVSLPVNGLQGLSSLVSLRIQCCMKFASLSEGVQYLTSLQDLIISGCPELTSLPQSIQHLSSLRSLRIWGCKGLITLPNEIQHLASLSKLQIENCSNLMCLPQGMRSLTALKTLIIKGCLHLERRCKEGTGEDWPNIAHIPSIDIGPGRNSGVTLGWRRSLLTRVVDWTCGISRKF